MTNNFFNFTGLYENNYIPGHKLIQCYEYTIDSRTKYELENINLVILCYNLYINNDFKNHGGDITIFCRNIYGGDNASLDVSGKSSEFIAGKMSSGTDSDPNGPHAKNINKEVGSFANKLNAGNAGNIRIYAEKAHGKITFISNGGNGAKGQGGGDAIQNKNGIPVTADVYQEKGDPFSIVAIPEPIEKTRLRARGGDGKPPTNGGDGANGGNASAAGDIIINIETWEYFKELSKAGKDGTAMISMAGEPGQGGDGGAPGKGGSGGTGAKVYEWINPMYRFHSVGETGTDLSGVRGNPGKNGESGNITKRKGKQFAFAYYGEDYQQFVFGLPSHYFRLLVLAAEDFYINNKVDKALEIIDWILFIESILKVGNNQLASSPSVYYSLEDTQNFEPFFSRCRTYLNQIRHGYDFFANGSNYVTLLDDDFINQTILNYRGVLKDYESLLEKSLADDYSIVSDTASSEKIKQAIQSNVDLLRSENAKLSEQLITLNAEIIKRQNEINAMQTRILLMEGAFKRAVESAANECTFEKTLATIKKLTTIGAGLAATIGGVGASAAIWTDTTALVADFFGKIQKVRPGFDTDDWKKMFEIGKDDNKDKDTSLINRVEIIKKKGKEFKDDFEAIADAIKASEPDGNDLLSIPVPGNADVSGAKQKFIEQMKDFIGKFSEAQEYQEEVLHYFDFCDITNQKRIQFTGATLTVMLNTDSIAISESDIYSINYGLFQLNDKKLSAAAKTVIVDTYLRMRTFFVKLIYLYKKSIDFIKLENSSFSATFFTGKTAALGETYEKSLSDLVDHLNATVSPSVQSNSDNPFEISAKNYPISFEKLKSANISDGTIAFYFSIFTDAYGMDTVREIRIISVRVYFEGASTKSSEIAFDLKHFGNSTFIKSNNEAITFTHQPVTKPLRYSLKDKRYSDFFNKVKSKYEMANLKTDHYVGISPFSNWGIFIGKNSINSGLNLSQLEKINIIFEYECTSEDH